MSPNTIGFVDREGASAWLNEPAAVGAKRTFGDRTSKQNVRSKKRVTSTLALKSKLRARRVLPLHLATERSARECLPMSDFAFLPPARKYQTPMSSAAVTLTG
jgi:hypothetical protein